MGRNSLFSIVRQNVGESLYFFVIMLIISLLENRIIIIKKEIIIIPHLLLVFINIHVFYMVVITVLWLTCSSSPIFSIGIVNTCKY